MEASSKAIWDTMAEASRSHGEHNDCTVKALTAATGLDYDTCHAALAAEGRRNRRGCNWFTMGPRAANKLGFNMERITGYSAKTMISAERDRRLAKGRFVAQVRGHVAAVVDGNVVDWTQGRRHKIQYIYECTPIPGFAAPTAPTAGPLPTGSADWRSFRKYTKQDNLELF